MTALIDDALSDARRDGAAVGRDAAPRLSPRRARAIAQVVLGVAADRTCSLFQTNLLVVGGRAAVSRDAAAPADAIVVFAGGVGESGKAGGGYQERVEAGGRSLQGRLRAST